jgi:RsiW-degrading membrane proteinase PrsW (M82 family)
MATMQRDFAGQCIVCGREVTERRVYGGRQYCDLHFQTFHQDNRPVWQASVLTFSLIGLLIVGIAVANVLFGVEPVGTARLITGVAIAVFPALIWLGLLYWYTTAGGATVSALVPTVFVLSALIAAAVTRPLLYDLIDLDSWLAQASAAERFLTNILVVSSLHTFLLYAIVRYTVWRTPVFERRTDGVMFALVAAWGYAAAFNSLWVIDQGGLSMLNGNLRIVTQTCAFLISALIIGYFLGRNRFEELAFYYLGAGMGLAAILGGLLLYAGTELNNIRVSVVGADGYSPWPGLVVNLLVLALAFAGVFGLIRRHNALTRARLEQAA